MEQKPEVFTKSWFRRQARGSAGTLVWMRYAGLDVCHVTYCETVSNRPYRCGLGGAVRGRTVSLVWYKPVWYPPYHEEALSTERIERVYTNLRAALPELGLEVTTITNWTHPEDVDKRLDGLGITFEGYFLKCLLFSSYYIELNNQEGTTADYRCRIAVCYDPIQTARPLGYRLLLFSRGPLRWLPPYEDVPISAVDQARMLGVVRRYLAGRFQRLNTEVVEVGYEYMSRSCQDSHASLWFDFSP